MYICVDMIDDILSEIVGYIRAIPTLLVFILASILFTVICGIAVFSLILYVLNHV